MYDLTADERRLIRLLEDQHVFPGPFTFKIFFRNVPAAGESILAAVEAQTGVRTHEPPTLRASSKGSYVSMTVSLKVDQSVDVVRVYRALNALESVISCF